MEMQSRRIEIAKLSLALFAKCETLAKFLIISLLIGTVQKIYATAKCGLSLKGNFLVSGFAIMYSKRVKKEKSSCGFSPKVLSFPIDF